MSQTKEFEGRRVLVAGGSRGIGRAIATAFAAQGASVSICARGADTLEATRAELAAYGVATHAMVCDLGDGAQIEAWVHAAAAALGGVDVLVNNASAFGAADTEEAWAASLNVDVQAVVRASRSALPHLLKDTGPSIVNISSISVLRPSIRTPAYGAAQAAVATADDDHVKLAHILGRGRQAQRGLAPRGQRRGVVRRGLLEVLGEVDRVAAAVEAGQIAEGDAEAGARGLDHAAVVPRPGLALGPEGLGERLAVHQHLEAAGRAGRAPVGDPVLRAHPDAVLAGRGQRCAGGGLGDGLSLLLIPF